MARFTYEDIIKEAKNYANRVKAVLPSLPSYEELSPYRTILTQEFANLNAEVKGHASKHETEPGHGYEHLYWVATNGGYFAELECNARNIESEIRNRLIRRTIVFELLHELHDIERYRGLKEHVTEGVKVAKELMSRCSIVDSYIPDLILVMMKLVYFRQIMLNLMFLFKVSLMQTIYFGD